jgi:CRP-like cAMP-binding protein
MSKQTMDRVRDLALFSGCGRSQRRRIDRLGSFVDVPGPAVLCREGQLGRQFFVLVEGTAAVRARSGAVAILHPGAWFGEISLLSRRVRQATVSTSGPATVLVFDPREFAELLEIAPGVARRLRASCDVLTRTDRLVDEPWYQPIPALRSALVPVPG